MGALTEVKPARAMHVELRFVAPFALAMACGVCVSTAFAQPLPGASGATSGSAASATELPEAKFRLVDIELAGATLLTPSQWREGALPFLGRDITFAELESARAAIEARFHAAGWRLVTVRIPAQSTSNGTVRMEAFEPKLASVKLKSVGTPVPAGSARKPETWRAALPALVEGSTPNLNDLDKQLAIANDTGSRRSQVAITLENVAIGAAPGSARQLTGEIQTEEQASSHFQAFIDNSGNKQTGRLRYGVAFRHDNLWGLDHQLNAQIASAPHDEDNPEKLSLLPSTRVQILGLAYRVPLPDNAALIDATLAYSNVDSGTVANVFQVAGQGTTAGLKYTQLLDRVGSWEPRVFVGIDWRQYKSQLLFGGQNLAVPIELHPVQIGVSANRIATPQNPLGASAYASFHVNLPGGSNGSQSSFTATRLDAAAHYKLLRFGSSINLPVGAWQLNAALDAQLTNDLLVSSEQLAAGGVTTVRGFSDRGIGGDSGLRVQVEAVSPNWLSGSDGNLAVLRGVVFVDAASTRRNRPAVFEEADASIASAGVGLRGAWGATVWRVDLAKAIHQKTQGVRASGAVHFSVATRF